MVSERTDGALIAEGICLGRFLGKPTGCFGLLSFWRYLLQPAEGLSGDVFEKTVSDWEFYSLSLHSGE